MAITNYDRVGKAMELLKLGIYPFIEREFKSVYGGRMIFEANRVVGNDSLNQKKAFSEYDVAALFKIMLEAWNEVFRQVLGPAERSLVFELRDVRNSWAHQKPFSTDDAYRALDSVSRLLSAVSAPQASEIDKIKQELLRVSFDEKERNAKRRTAEMALESQVTAGVKPWRDVVTPHRDVTGGYFKSAEFAADLLQVHIGEAAPEYGNPVEFFRRTYITESLKSLLSNAIERMYGKGGDPVVQLQTNFGGGKTHSMLALYHLFSGTPLKDLEGIEEISKKAGISELPEVKRVVLVGNRISPGNPTVKEDGTQVRTLWGELAWQLGGKDAHEKIRADDENATSPGDRLRELLEQASPCLILIDEWVAYARQLHDDSDLPAGSFETQFSFAQLLTESAKLVKQCLLVISLPASDTTGSPHTLADDTEVGGKRGREALDRLRNVIGRLESSWRPATAEEGFEIVRRRLFEPLINNEQYIARDSVASAYRDLYRTYEAEFPAECKAIDYEKRIKAAYPIHPELFDRLYQDWSTLLKFQRTRGVLRLMALVIRSLWESNDKSPLIMPSSIPINDPSVQSELTRYLSDNWVPIIEKDVDGPNSLPHKIDSEWANLGRLSATRRVARTIFLGSAPITTAAHYGLEDKRIKLGCAMPGESPAIFGDALRRLSNAATYLYQDGVRSWYSIQPTVTKMASDRAEDLKNNDEKVNSEVVQRLNGECRNRGEFSAAHVAPLTSHDVSDEYDAGLVVLNIDYPYSKDDDCPAVKAAQSILETRGINQRYYRNILYFLAADKNRLIDLDEAVRNYLAWKSIIEDKDKLDLTPFQVKTAETQVKNADTTVNSQIYETYQWLLVPIQKEPSSSIEWKSLRVSGRDPLAVRACKKLKNEDMLVTGLASSWLKRDLDTIPLWRGNHVAIKQLVEDYAQYLYLFKLRDSSVIHKAIQQGLGMLTWRQDSFAYAESYDEEAGRYRGLICGRQVDINTIQNYGLVVRSEVADNQIKLEAVEKEAETEKNTSGETGKEKDTGNGTQIDIDGATIIGHQKPKRFHGSVQLDPLRTSRDAGKIAEEVIAHLSGIVNADVSVTLEIQAIVPDGIPENVVRIVTENSRTLKFTSQGFEEE
ncbi:MAG: Swt1 family HEPN domain-containing protein [Limnochordia bacterium]|nr:Swt1 family HEPN domain-containing protein [Limnochordia bacterium]